MRCLKIHIIKEWNKVKECGLTECGEPFFKGRLSHGDSYEAVRRIGGLRAVHLYDLVPNRHVCRKCLPY